MNLFANARKSLTVYASALTLGISAAVAAAPAAAQETFTWKVQSHWPGASSSYTDSLVRLQRVLEERTDGRLKLNLYEAGALFKAQETFNAVSRGILEMGTISPSYAQDKVSLAGIASGLPFAFRNVWEAEYFHQGMGFEQMLRDEAAEHNVYWATDKVYPTEMVIKKPIVKDALDEQFWIRTNEYLYKERLTLAKVIAEQGVQTNVLPDDVQDKLVKAAQAMWDEEGERSDNAKKALDMLKGYLAELGYL